MQLFTASFAGARPAHHHDIDGWEYFSLSPETFTNHPLDPVTVDRLPGTLPGDGEAEPCATRDALAAEYRKAGVPHLACPGEDPAVVLRGKQPHAARKPLWPVSATQGIVTSGGKTGSALGTACLENLASAGGRHAGTEAVGALAVKIAGLECSLHDGSRHLAFIWLIKDPGIYPSRHCLSTWRQPEFRISPCVGVVMVGLPTCIVLPRHHFAVVLGRRF